jgi:hypothetical protein
LRDPTDERRAFFAAHLEALVRGFAAASVHALAPVRAALPEGNVDVTLSVKAEQSAALADQLELACIFLATFGPIAYARQRRRSHERLQKLCECVESPTLLLAVDPARVRAIYADLQDIFEDVHIVLTGLTGGALTDFNGFIERWTSPATQAFGSNSNSNSLALHMRALLTDCHAMFEAVRLNADANPVGAALALGRASMHVPDL